MKIRNLSIKDFYSGTDIEIDFKISERLLSSEESKFTLIIGENGVRKTTLLREIYGLFRKIECTSPSEAKINDNDTDIDICNQSPKEDVNVVIDSFALLDKLSKNNLKRLRKHNVASYRNMINLRVILDFINNLVYTNLSDIDKFNKTLEVFKFLKIDPERLVLTWSKAKIGRRRSDFYLKKIAESDSIISRVDRIMSYIYKDPTLKEKWEDFEFGYYHRDWGEFSFKRDCMAALGLSESSESYRLSESKVRYVGMCRFIEDSIKHILESTIGDKIIYSANWESAIVFTDLKNFINKNEILFEVFALSKDYLERDFFTNLYINNDLVNNKISKYNESYQLLDLSSGELGTLLRLTKLVLEVERNSVVLIDEPELHLHPSWMVSYIYRLKKLFGNYNCHFIIATHSPLLVSNLNGDDIIILEKKDNKLNAINAEVGTFAVGIDEILSSVFGVRLIDSDLISGIFEKIKSLLDSNNKEEQLSGMKWLKSLPDSAEKIDLFMEYYDLLMELSDGR